MHIHTFLNVYIYIYILTYIYIHIYIYMNMYTLTLAEKAWDAYRITGKDKKHRVSVQPRLGLPMHK
jgi:hypothetical protein